VCEARLTSQILATRSPRATVQTHTAPLLQPPHLLPSMATLTLSARQHFHEVDQRASFAHSCQGTTSPLFSLQGFLPFCPSSCSIPSPSSALFFLLSVPHRRPCDHTFSLFLPRLCNSVFAGGRHRLRHPVHVTSYGPQSPPHNSSGFSVCVLRGDLRDTLADIFGLRLNPHRR